MANSDCFVSVVAPLYNNAAIVTQYVIEVTQLLKDEYTNYELVLVDDGSDDSTSDIVDGLLAEFQCIRYIRLSRTYGEEIAISAGLDTVIGDFVVIMLPNQDPPSLIPQMVEKARSGFEIVYGIQRNPDKKSAIQRIGARLFYWYCRRYLKFSFTAGTSQFRVLSRKAVNAITRIKDRHRYLRYSSRHVGFASEGIIYDHISREGHDKKRDFFEAANLATSIIVSSSKHPFRIATWVGITASIMNVFYGGYIVAIYFFKDNVAEGWTTLSLQQATMFFFIFLILVILSEYIGQILDESQQRPMYYVLEEKTSSVMMLDELRRNVVRDSVD